MRHLLESLYQKIKFHLHSFMEDTAEAVEHGNRPRIVRNVIIAVIALLGTIGAFALLVGSVYVFRKTLLVWVGFPAMVIALIASYFEGQRDTATQTADRADRLLLRERAEALCEILRDGMYLVIAGVSEYAGIIRPQSPSAIETQTRYYIREGVAFYQFNALTSEAVDTRQLKRDLERVLSQKLRAGELPGLPTRLVEYEGRFYLPIQIVSVTDAGASVNIDVVFANHRSLPLIEARAQLCLGREYRAPKTEIPFDDEF